MNIKIYCTIVALALFFSAYCFSLSDHSYSIDGNRLIIFRMEDYLATTQPWWEHRQMIEEVMICNGITMIGNNAFLDFEVLKSVFIPETVTRIGENAFRGCKSLSSIIIPQNVSIIEEYAFWNCTNLAYITNYQPAPVSINLVFNFEKPVICILKVPEESYFLYKKAEGWKDFLIIPHSDTSDSDTDSNNTASESSFVIVIASLPTPLAADRYGKKLGYPYKVVKKDDQRYRLVVDSCSTEAKGDSLVKLWKGKPGIKQALYYVRWW